MERKSKLVAGTTRPSFQNAVEIGTTEALVFSATRARIPATEAPATGEGRELSCTSGIFPRFKPTIANVLGSDAPELRREGPHDCRVGEIGGDAQEPSELDRSVAERAMLGNHPHHSFDAHLDIANELRRELARETVPGDERRRLSLEARDTGEEKLVAAREDPAERRRHERERVVHHAAIGLGGPRLALCGSDERKDEKCEKDRRLHFFGRATTDTLPSFTVTPKSTSLNPFADRI